MNHLEVLSCLQVDAVHGVDAKRSKTYLDTSCEHRKATTKQCPTSNSRVGSFAGKQSIKVQGAQS